MEENSSSGAPVLRGSPRPEGQSVAGVSELQRFKARISYRSAGGYACDVTFGPLPAPDALLDAVAELTRIAQMSGFGDAVLGVVNNVITEGRPRLSRLDAQGDTQ